MSWKRTIYELPDEILVEIFSYLSVEDIILNVKNVSNRWEEVVKDCRLWKHLTYRPAYRISENDTIEFLKKTPLLRWFVPKYPYTTGKLLEAVITYCKEIRELKLCINKSECSLVEKMVEECKNIERLTVNAGDFAENKSLEIISKCMKLKSLRLIGYVSKRNNNFFADLSKGCPSLEKVDLRYLTHNNNEALESFLKARKDTIKSLYLFCCIEGQLCSLPVVLEACPMLQLLHVIGHCGVPFVEDFASLKNMRNLKNLSLPDMRCRNAKNVREFFETGFVHNLVTLDLTSFENFGKRLAHALFENCYNLKDLNLDYCRKLSDESLKNICNLKQLECLHMDGCESITDTGVVYIVKCTKLKLLNLNNCAQITNSSFVLCCSELKMLRELHMNNCKVESHNLLQVPEKLKNLRMLSISMIGLKQRVIRNLQDVMPVLDILLQHD